jgi:hypothetical protein
MPAFKLLKKFILVRTALYLFIISGIYIKVVFN